MEGTEDIIFRNTFRNAFRNTFRNTFRDIKHILRVLGDECGTRLKSSATTLVTCTT